MQWILLPFNTALIIVIELPIKSLASNDRARSLISRMPKSGRNTFRKDVPGINLEEIEECNYVVRVKIDVIK